MKTYQLLLLSICVLIFSGCGDCFVPTPIVPNEKPIVREATIAVFNSTIDTLNNRTPVPEFNIATFRFPYSSYSSGDLPNNQKFSAGPWTFAEKDYPLTGYTTTYSFNSPPNSLMDGDILVESVTLPPISLEPETRLRFKGDVFPINTSLKTDDANIFATYVQNLGKQSNPGSNLAFCAFYDASALAYKQDSTGNNYSIVASNPTGNPKTFTFPSSWPLNIKTLSVLPPFRNVIANDLSNYSVRFNIGDVFYYKAQNGTNFFVLISNIQEGVLAPKVRRVTVKFAEAYKCEECKEN